MINTKYRSILALLLVSGKLAWAIDVFDVRVATAKTRYYPGEQIEIRITVPTPGVLSFGTTLQTLYTMNQVYTPSLAGLQIPTQTTTPHTWTMSHDWRAYNIAPGHHTVVGRVLGYGSSSPAGFDVVPPPAPSGNFVLDFETILGTAAPVAHLVAYDALGVHFRTCLGAACELHGDSRGRWVEGFDRYPIGFYVAADFAMPVFGASARVAGWTGVRITMTARNAQGQAIAIRDRSTGAVCADVIRDRCGADCLSGMSTERAQFRGGCRRPVRDHHSRPEKCSCRRQTPSYVGNCNWRQLSALV